MKKFLVIALAIGTIVGCKKKDETPAQLDVTLANIAGTYKITGDVSIYNGITLDNLNGSTIAGQAIPADYKPCEVDDTYSFTASGKVANKDAGTVCSPATPTDSSSFSLNTSSKVITLPSNVGQSGFTSGTVSSLTANGMVVTNTETQSGISYVNTITFTKQ